MTERIEQRACIKFCQKLGHSCSETIAMIHKTYGNESMSHTQIKEWFRRFKNGRTLVGSDPRSGRPATSKNPETVERIRALINQNPRLTVREIEADLGIPKTTVAEILKYDLQMSGGQKSSRMKVGRSNVETNINNHDIFKKSDDDEDDSDDSELSKKIFSKPSSVTGKNLENNSQEISKQSIVSSATMKLDDPRVNAAYDILKATVAKNDDCAMFGDHVANKIRKYSNRTQNVVRRRINSVLKEADQGKYDNHSESDAPESPTSSSPTPHTTSAMND